MGDSDRGYLLDNRRAEAGTRFEALSELFDAWTLQHVDRLGIGPGGRCWEIGAGGLAIPRALAERVAPGGRVLATDIDLTWMRSDSADLGDLGPVLEVREHNVTADPLPGHDFDLVHARLVLVHLPDRERALEAMVQAVRPGGWVLIEDADPALQPLACPDEQGPAEELANRIRVAFRTLMARRGADLAFGRTLPRVMRNAGLVDVRGEAFFPIAGAATNLLERATVEHVRDHLVEQRLATDAEIDRYLDDISAQRMDLTTGPLITVWGRRPG